MFTQLIYAIKGSITMSPLHQPSGGSFQLTANLEMWSVFVPLGGSDFAVAIMATLQSYPFSST